jgi:tetratricopeptide (TPR) repeat protein
VAELLQRLRAALADRYTVERPLGAGGMATVYLATDLKQGRKVALKVLRPELAAALGAERFLHEIRITATLQHPNILPLFDSGQADDLLFYVMPWIEGESLQERLIHEKQLPLEDALRITSEVARALEYAHAHEVIHRDVKPANILLSGGQAILADFGIARAVTEAGGEKLTATGLALGTPAYMSPEQAAGGDGLDRRSDIYSLGCVLYEMLAGDPPFTGSSAQAIIARKSAEPAPRLRTVRDTVPPALDGVILRALARVPADRFATAAQFEKALAHAAGGGVTGHSWLGATNVSRALLRHRWLVPAVALAGVGAGAGWWATGRTPLDSRRVAVTAFVNQTGDAKLDGFGALASDVITRGLTETDAVEVVGSGASTAIRGRFYRQGERLQFTAEIADLRSGRVLAMIGPESAPVDTPSAGLAALQSRVMGSVAMMFDRNYGMQGIVLGQPPRYEAYREYLAGEEAFYRGRMDSAETRFRRAVALDSTFHLPLIRIQNAYLVARRYPQADSALERLSDLRGSLSPFEAAFLDVWAAMPDYNAAYAAAQTMARVAPQSEFAAYYLAMMAHWSGRRQEAVTILRRLNPEGGVLWGRLYYDYFTNALHLLGDHKRELEAAERGARQYPGTGRFLVQQVRALAALGRVDDVNALVATSFTLRSQVGWGDPLRGRRGSLPANAMWAGVSELRAHGRPQAALALNQRLLRWLATLPAADAGRLRAERGAALYVASRWAEAAAVFDSLSAEHPDSVAFLGWRGRVAARRGDRATAQQISAQLGALTRPYLFGSNTRARADIVAILGDKETAVQLLRDAIAQGELAAFLEDGIDFDGLRDYPPFQELLRPRP